METFFPSALLKPPSQCLTEWYSLGTAYWVGVFKCFVHTAQERRLQKRKRKTLLQLEIKWIGQRSWKNLQYPHTNWTPRSFCTWIDTLMLPFKVRQHLEKHSTFHCPNSQKITNKAQRVCLGQSVENLPLITVTSLFICFLNTFEFSLPAFVIHWESQSHCS